MPGMTPVFMFPGQSSREPGMFDRLLALRSDNRLFLEEASDILHRHLARHYHRDNAQPFAENRDVQIGVFLANHMFMATLEAEGISAELSLGLSLGEYNHLVHIGCIDFHDALRVVDARGVAYDCGAQIAGGAMASCFPISLAELKEVVARARAHGLLEIANLNSPQQHVISGETAAVEAAMAILEDEFAIHPKMIEQRVPMHSSRFRPVADLLRPALEAAAFRPPKKPYLPNVLAELRPAATPTEIVELLCRHVYESVRWCQSIELLADRHPDAHFVEVGPREVLYNLLSLRWRRVQRSKTDCACDIRQSFTATIARLRNAA
jgi:[acyl-carrier-protein] S-malonyltransferase